jgi:hypothetical protein
MKNEIKVGSIVSIKNGYGMHYRITSYRGSKVNLGSIFGKTIYHKGVPVENVYENEKEWYRKWSKIKGYVCM